MIDYAVTRNWRGERDRPTRRVVIRGEATDGLHQSASISTSMRVADFYVATGDLSKNDVPPAWQPASG
jgi:hypothetical protein